MLSWSVLALGVFAKAQVDLDATAIVRAANVKLFHASSIRGSLEYYDPDHSIDGWFMFAKPNRFRWAYWEKDGSRNESGYDGTYSWTYSSDPKGYVHKRIKFREAWKLSGLAGFEAFFKQPLQYDPNSARAVEVNSPRGKRRGVQVTAGVGKELALFYFDQEGKLPMGWTTPNMPSRLSASFTNLRLNEELPVAKFRFVRP